MNNIKDIRKNLEIYKKKISERNTSIDFEALMQLDEENRVLIQKKEKKEQKKKLLSKSNDPLNFEISKKLSKEIISISKSQNNLQDKIFSILSNIPNLAHNDVPIGKDEKSNKLMHTKGQSIYK